MPVIQVAASEATSRFVPLGIGKSVAIDLPGDIKDVLVADPKIANAVVRTARRVYMIGVTVGQTNIFFFDAEGRQIAGFDIAVTRDLNGVRAALKQHHAGCRHPHRRRRRDGIVLSGTAASPAEAQQAFDLAARLVGDGTKVVNGITMRGRDQVMLKVTVAEVQRDVIKQLGIDLSGSFNYGTAVVNFNTINPFSAIGQALSDTSIAGSFKNVTATLRAMERAGVIRTLAEPNLTAISGETAKLPGRRRISDPGRLTCDTDQVAAGLSTAGRVQEIRRQPELHAGGAVGRPHQPEGDDRSLRTLDRERVTLSVPGSSNRDHPVDQDPPRRDHGRDSLRRLARDGRHDPGTDQAADQRHCPG